MKSLALRGIIISLCFIGCYHGTFILERENTLGALNENSTTLKVSQEYFIRNAAIDIHWLGTNLHDAKYKYRKGDSCIIYLGITEKSVGKRGYQFSFLIQVNSLNTNSILLSNRNTAVAYWNHYPVYKLNVTSGLLNISIIEEDNIEGRLILECSFRNDDKDNISNENLENQIFKLNGDFQISKPLYSSLSR